MQTYSVTARCLDGHGSRMRCKTAELVADTDPAGRADAFNPAELLLAAVARTNKIARIGDTPRSLLRGAPVWAMMARGEARRGPTHATA